MRSYYNEHQIASKYTFGGEYITLDGIGYVGGYHIVIPTGQIYTDFKPSDKSVELVKYQQSFTPTTLEYNRITNKQISRYVSPVIYYPILSDQDYINGTIERFLIQKRSEPWAIMEIDYNQFNSINQENRPGINGVIYEAVKILWRISNLDHLTVQSLNLNEINRNIPKYPYLNTVLRNPLEFVR